MEGIEIYKIGVHIELLEGMLGTSSANEEIHSEYIASKAPDAKSMEEEIAAIGVAGVEEKTKTIFPRDENGNPFLWDYQIKGMMKDSCGMLRKVPNSKSSKIKAYKKEIDGLIFVHPRKIPIHLSGPITDCQRPLRAQTMQGERVALATSEEVPAGSTIDFEIEYMSKDAGAAIREWLDYGELRGLGQWRNSGKGRYVWKETATE